MNEQAVLAELARLYLISRELEQALEQARAEKCPEPELHRLTELATPEVAV